MPATPGSRSSSSNSSSPANKQLSSRYRGVCWNKKNKRWQAAINSSGKYIYLGSYTNEDDAARQFDRAAIKVRGNKAKLNFSYSDYVDEDGNLVDDLVLPAGSSVTKDDLGAAAAAGRGSKRGRSGERERASGSGGEGGQAAAAAAAAAAGGGGGGVADAACASWAAAALAAPAAARGVAMCNAGDLGAFMPKGCVPECMLPGLDAEMFGIVFRHEASGKRGCGVWTGRRFHLFGVYAEEDDARQTAVRAMALLHEDRQARQQPGAAAAAAAAPAQAPADDPLIAALGFARHGGGSGAGAAAAAAGGGIRALTDCDVARAAQLAQQAAAEQAAANSNVDLELQARLAQLLQGSGAAPPMPAPPPQQQQQQQQGGGAAAAALYGSLAELDMTALAHLVNAGAQTPQAAQGPPAPVRQQPEQPQPQPQPQQPEQQQGAQGSRAAAVPGGALASTSIQELMAVVAGSVGAANGAGAGGVGEGGSNAAAAAAAAGAGAGTGSARLFPELLSFANGGPAGDAEAPAAKRARASGAGADGGDAAPGTGPSGSGGAGAAAADDAWWSSLSKIGLQDALKALCAQQAPQ